MEIPYSVSDKIIVSGRYVEHYHYEKPYWVGYPRIQSSRLSIKRIKDQELIRDDNVRRTRIKIRRLINSNQDLDRFMTLTFNTPILDLSQSNPLFRIFIKRVKRLYPHFKYICVPEFQPVSGRVHYHLLCNIPFTSSESLQQLWQQGYAFLRKIDKIDNLGAYICKYLGKANFDRRYFGKNKFFYSYNLLRPIIVDKSIYVARILKQLPVDFVNLCEKCFEFEFLTKFLGMIYYKQYKLWEGIKVVPQSI